jgi:hypothetical protein
MGIFVRKHFSNGTMKGFIHLIQAAIFISALLAILKKFLRWAFLPLADSIVIYLVYQLATTIWGAYKFGTGYRYPELFTDIIIPCYMLVTVIEIAVFSGYRLPSKYVNSLKGLLAGTLIILVIYALLPSDLRFSRAIILISALLAAFAIPFYRLLVSSTWPEIAENPLTKTRKTVIVSDFEGYLKIRDLVETTGTGNIIAGRVSIRKEDMTVNVLGNLADLSEVLRVNRIKEVIFSTRDLSASQIIDSMHEISGRNITIRIASAGEKYLIGSRYISREKNINPLINNI